MSRMNLHKLIARVNNAEKTSQGEKSLEAQLLQMHEEVAEVSKALREARVSKIQPIDFNAMWTDEKGHLQGFGIEMVDVLFRWCRIVALTGMDFETFVEMKASEIEGRAVKS